MKVLGYPECKPRDVALPTVGQALHHKVRVVRPDSFEAVKDVLERQGPKLTEGEKDILKHVIHKAEEQQLRICASRFNDWGGKYVTRK